MVNVKIYRFLVKEIPLEGGSERNNGVDKAPDKPYDIETRIYQEQGWEEIFK